MLILLHYEIHILHTYIINQPLKLKKTTIIIRYKTTHDRWITFEF